MTQQRRAWVAPIMTILFLSVFLAGCPKRPEVTETAPKAIGPQGAIAMPAPPLPPPPTVTATPPTVTAPDQLVPEVVAAQAQQAEAAPEDQVEEIEAQSQGVETVPGEGTVPHPQPAESGITPKRPIGEGDVSAATPSDGKEASPGSAMKEGEVIPQAPAPIQEAEETPGPEDTQVKGAEVTAPSPAEPSTEGASAAGPAESAAVAPVAPAPVSAPSAPGPESAVVAEAPKAPELTVKDIFFDFDQAAIRDDSKKTLADNIQWLKANGAAKVTIEGHCDERGSSEYNLALGERRARVTRDFFVAAGVDVSRINTISYGKERPFVLGHDEAAWKWNRRAHFVVITK